MNQTRSQKTRAMVLAGIFSAIILVMAFVPFMGYINLVAIKATTIHIPVIIGAILLGPKYGAFLGFVFGLTSLINNTYNFSLSSFVFSPFVANGGFQSLIICFVPRILVGVTAAYTYKGVNALARIFAKEAGSGNPEKGKFRDFIALPAAGLIGSITNTILVMNLIYFLFGQSYAAAQNVAFNTLYSFILGIIFTNGIPEALVAAVLTTVIGKVLLSMKKRLF